MAYAFVANNSKATGSGSTVSTLALTSFGAVIPAGTLLVLVWACATATHTGTVADNSTQSGNANVYTVFTAGAGATLSGGFLWCYTTRQIQTTDTITLTMSATSPESSFQVLGFSGASANTQLDAFFLLNTKTTSPFTMGATPAMAESGCLAVGLSGWKGGNATSGVAATSSGYTLVAGTQGGTTTRVETDASYNISVGTAATTSTHTFTSVTAGFGAILCFRPNATLPTATDLDDFTGAVANLTSRAGWSTTAVTSSGDTFSLKSNGTTAAVETNGTPASNMWATQLSADQEAGFSWTGVDSTRVYTRGDRLSTSGVTLGYRSQVGFSGGVDIENGTGGSTLISATLAPSGGSFANMDWLLQSKGTRHTLWQRTPALTGPWRAILATTDATTNAVGYIGIQAPSGNTPTIDQFLGKGIGANNYTQSLSGGFTPTGALTRTLTLARTLSGGFTPTGKIIKQVAKTFFRSGFFAVTPTLYGMPWQAGSLDNLEIGKFAGRQICIRFRAATTTTLSTVSFALAYGTGYSLGTGGSVKCAFQADDGTVNHLPSGTDITSVTVSTPAGTPGTESAGNFTFSSPPSVTAGTLYHIVLTGADADPINNWVSMDGTYTVTPQTPAQPAFPDSDLFINVKPDTTDPWTPRPDVSAAPFNLAFANSTNLGWAVDYVPSPTVGSGGALQSVGGANDAVRMNFTPSSTITVNVMHAFLYRQSGTTQPLSLQLKNSGGTILASGTVAASSIVSQTSGTVPADGTWATVSFTPVTLVSGSQYSFELWSTAETVPYQVWPVRVAESGNFSDYSKVGLFTDGWWEFTTNAGSTWSKQAGETGYKLMGYFETTSTAPSFIHATVFGRILTGALTFVGGLNKLTSHHFSASFTPTGGLTRVLTLFRTLSGSMTPTGSLTRALSLFRTLSGSMTPTGGLSRSTSRKLSGGFTPTGALTHVSSFFRTLTGGFTPTGALSRVLTLARTLSGGFTPTGALNRLTSRTLSGGFTPTGSLSRALTLFRTLTGGFTPTGVLSRKLSLLRTLTAGFTPTGSLSRSLTLLRTLSGSFTPTGLINRLTSRTLSGGFTPTGNLSRTLTLFRTLTAGFTPTGALSRTLTFFRSLSGSMTPTGLLNKLTARKLSAGFTPTGSLSRVGTYFRTLTAGFTPTGALNRTLTLFRTLSASFTPTGFLSTASSIINALTFSYSAVAGPVYNQVSGLIRSYSAVGVVSFIKQTAKSFAYAAVGAPSRVLQTNKPYSGSTTTSSTFTKTAGLVRLYSVTDTLSFLKRIGLIRSYTTSTVDTFTKKIQPSAYLYTASDTPSFVKLVGLPFAYTTSTTDTYSGPTTYARTYSAATTTVPTLIKTVALVRTYITTPTRTFNNMVIKTFSRTVTDSPVVNLQTQKTFSAGTTTVVTRTLQTQLPRTYTVTDTPSLLKSALLHFNYSSVTTPSFDRFQFVFITAAYTTSTVVSFVKQVGKLVTGGTSTTPTVTKQVAQTRSYTTTPVRSYVASTLKNFSYSVTDTPSFSRLRFATITAAYNVTTTISLNKFIRKFFSTSTTTVPSYNQMRPLTFTVTTATTPTAVAHWIPASVAGTYVVDVGDTTPTMYIDPTDLTVSLFLRTVDSPVTLAVEVSPDQVHWYEAIQVNSSPVVLSITNASPQALSFRHQVPRARYARVLCTAAPSGPAHIYVILSGGYHYH